MANSEQRIANSEQRIANSEQHPYGTGRRLAASLITAVISAVAASIPGESRRLVDEEHDTIGRHQHRRRDAHFPARHLSRIGIPDRRQRLDGLHLAVAGNDGSSKRERRHRRQRTVVREHGPRLGGFCWRISWTSVMPIGPSPWLSTAKTRQLLPRTSRTDSCGRPRAMDW